MGEAANTILFSAFTALALVSLIASVISIATSWKRNIQHEYQGLLEIWQQDNARLRHDLEDCLDQHRGGKTTRSYQPPIIKLSSMITSRLSMTELETIVLAWWAEDGGVNWEELGGDTIGAKTNSLINAAIDRQNLDRLMIQANRVRPDLDWPLVD